MFRSGTILKYSLEERGQDLMRALIPHFSAIFLIPIQLPLQNKFV